MSGYVMNGHWKVDKKPSGQLPSDESKAGRRSMTNGGGWHAGRVQPPSFHVISPEAYRNNFCPKSVSINFEGRWVSTPVCVSGPTTSEFREFTKSVFETVVRN